MMITKRDDERIFPFVTYTFGEKQNFFFPIKCFAVNKVSRGYRLSVRFSIAKNKEEIMSDIIQMDWRHWQSLDIKIYDM
jgi:hypothetical protein